MTTRIAIDMSVEEARKMAAALECPPGLRERIKNALPVEWEEGTVAWVTYGGEGRVWRSLAEWRDDGWRRSDSSRRLIGAAVIKVEPILTPGDVVLKAENLDGASWSKLRELAVAADREHYDHTAKLLHSLADQVSHHQGL